MSHIEICIKMIFSDDRELDRARTSPFVNIIAVSFVGSPGVVCTGTEKE